MGKESSANRRSLGKQKKRVPKMVPRKKTKTPGESLKKNLSVGDKEATWIGRPFGRKKKKSSAGMGGGETFEKVGDVWTGGGGMFKGIGERIGEKQTSQKILYKWGQNKLLPHKKEWGSI